MIDPLSSLVDWLQATLDTSAPVIADPLPSKSRNLSYRVAVTGGTYALKVIDPQREAAVAHELAILPYLHDRGFPVPAVLAIGRDLPGVFRTAVLREFLPGKPASERFTSLLPDARTLLLGTLGDLLARIHALPLGEVTAFWQYPEDTVRTPREWGTNFVQKKVASDLGVILPSRALDADISREIARVLPHWADTIADADVRIAPLHGDYYLDNLLVNDEGMICGLLDWEAARLGDPLWELARTQMAAFAQMPAAWETFIAAYAARAPWAIATGRIACYRFLMAMGDLRYAVRHAPALIPERAVSLARLWRHLAEEDAWS